jgi:predicted ATP-grasp superfamily ATP-dependent carboligase
MQPFAKGHPMSASYLVDSDARAWLIGIGEQRMVVTNGQFAYRGGCIPSTTHVDPRPLRAAVESVPGLRGFVGVDFVWDEPGRRAIVLEINPRPTTSVVGLTRLLPPGRLASAWIGAFEPGSAGASFLPELAGLVRRLSPVVFDAAGSVLRAGGS